MTATTLTGYPRTWAIVHAAQSVACPKCNAQPGHPCTSTGGGNYAEVALHTARRARVEHWTEQQRLQFGALVPHPRMRSIFPDGHFAEAEAAAKPIEANTAKQPTPRGVRLSEPQAARIEWAAQSGGRTCASTAHFSGDAAERQTVLSLVGKDILVEGDLTDHGYTQEYHLTVFGWLVYRQHRLIIRRLSEEDIDAGEAAAIAREADKEAVK